MPIQSFNTVNNKRLANNGIVRPLLIMLVVGTIYGTGFFTPQLLAAHKYAPANSVSKEFIANVTAGEYEQAVALGTPEFRELYKDPADVQEAVGNVLSQDVEYKDASEVKVENFYQLRQLVDGLPANPAGLTDGLFEVNTVLIDGNWHVASVRVL